MLAAKLILKASMNLSPDKNLWYLNQEPAGHPEVFKLELSAVSTSKVLCHVLSFLDFQNIL